MQERGSGVAAGGEPAGVFFPCALSLPGQLAASIGRGARRSKHDE
jgi:hypothetical protein